ncbi:hypothetical protein LINPERPRIM_LOCUS19035 [Linum perenne]
MEKISMGTKLMVTVGAFLTQDQSHGTVGRNCTVGGLRGAPLEAGKRLPAIDREQEEKDYRPLVIGERRWRACTDIERKDKGISSASQ